VDWILLIRIHRQQDITDERISVANFHLILDLVENRIIAQRFDGSQIFDIHLLHLVVVILNVTFVDQTLTLLGKVDRFDVFLKALELLREL